MLRETVEKYEQDGGITETMSLECQMCHQTVLCKVTPDMIANKEILREIALENCTCKEAKYIVKKKMQKEQIEEKMQKVLGDNSPAPVSQEIYDAIKEAAHLVCWKKIWKATINLSKNEKVKLTVDSDGQLNIVRELKQITGEIV